MVSGVQKIYCTLEVVIYIHWYSCGGVIRFKRMAQDTATSGVGKGHNARQKELKMGLDHDKDTLLHLLGRQQT